jgi:hypothetical protein
MSNDAILEKLIDYAVDGLNDDEWGNGRKLGEAEIKLSRLEKI